MGRRNVRDLVSRRRVLERLILLRRRHGLARLYTVKLEPSSNSDSSPAENVRASGSLAISDCGRSGVSGTVSVLEVDGMETRIALVALAASVLLVSGCSSGATDPQTDRAFAATSTDTPGGMAATQYCDSFMTSMFVPGTGVCTCQQTCNGWLDDPMCTDTEAFNQIGSFDCDTSNQANIGACDQHCTANPRPGNCLADQACAAASCGLNTGRCS
jgi:hypothetical protein